jgi:hypothetical protein
MLTKRRNACFLLAAVGAAWFYLPSAGADEVHDQVCNDEYDSCKETCTLEFGSSFDTRGKLFECNNKCASRHRTCLAGPSRPRASDGGTGTPTDAGRP